MGKAASTGKIARVKMDVEFSIWSPLALIRIDGMRSSPTFYEQALKSKASQAQIDVLCTSNTQKNISMDDIPRLIMTRPPLPEQEAIATFLDRETAKIDALISEQQRLIELLQEKRQAVISHAVTKGLNPDAPMKDSGVEWLGEVPDDWKMKRVKHLCEYIEQGWSPQCENESSEGDAPGVLKVGCVNGGVFRPSENKRLPADLSPIPQYGVRRGDLLVSRANTKELVGSAAVAEKDYPWLYICDKLYRITVMPGKAASNYLALYFVSNEARGQLELGASGASQSMQNISQSVLMEMPIPLPEPDEQERIINAVAVQCNQIDHLRTNASEAIGLLQERRSALISAAVTGQIDVRGLVSEADTA
jgi:type I restriction enzyme S subunit